MHLTLYRSIPKPFKAGVWSFMAGKTPFLISAIALSTIVAGGACGVDPDDDFTTIKGAQGSPRFNLQFTNAKGSDLDLYVQTPDGSVINYQDITAQRGKMDVDCLCGDCPAGGNENVYWVPGTAPNGVYKVWARYFDPCVGDSGAAAYKLRIMDGDSVIKLVEGVLSTSDRRSPVLIFER